MFIRKRKGFTLGEMVITVAVLGTISAISIPNYLRIKMNVNMEAVKQHLKVIGEEQTQLAGRTGKFVSEDTWGSGASSDEELSITANLSGINNKGYTTDEYFTDLNQASFSYRTGPQEGKWGISGNRYFLVDALGVREIQGWEAWNPQNFAIMTEVPSPTIQSMFGTSNPSLNQIESWFLQKAAQAKVTLDDYHSKGKLLEFDNPALTFQTSSQTSPLEELLKNTLSNPTFYNRLTAKGLEVSYFPAGSNPYSFRPGAYTTIGFKLSDAFKKYCTRCVL